MSKAAQVREIIKGCGYRFGLTFNDKRANGARRIKCIGYQMDSASAEPIVAAIKQRLTEVDIVWEKVQYRTDHLPTALGQDFYCALSVTFQD